MQIILFLLFLKISAITEEIKNMDIEVFKNYVKNLKKTNNQPKIEKKQIKNNIDYGVSL